MVGIEEQVEIGGQAEEDPRHARPSPVVGDELVPAVAFGRGLFRAVEDVPVEGLDEDVGVVAIAVRRRNRRLRSVMKAASCSRRGRGKEVGGVGLLGRRRRAVEVALVDLRGLDIVVLRRSLQELDERDPGAAALEVANGSREATRVGDTVEHDLVEVLDEDLVGRGGGGILRAS